MDPVEMLRRFRTTYRGLAGDRRAFDARRQADPEFCSGIESLYSHFVGTFRRYCGDCWHDAFIQLLTLTIMDNKSRFRLRAGTLLHDPIRRDVRYMLTPRRLAAMGDDLALRHLAHNPHAVEYFEKPLPDGLGRMIADYLRRERAAEAAESSKGTDAANVAAGKPDAVVSAEADAAAPAETKKRTVKRRGTPRTKVSRAGKGAVDVPHRVAEPGSEGASAHASEKSR